MRIADILNNLRNQVSCILEKKECNKIVFYRMLKTFFFVSKQLDILHFWSTIKALQIVLILIVKSILTGNAYRYISLTLLIAYFALVCYIITDQFIILKQDTKISIFLAPSLMRILHRQHLLLTDAFSRKALSILVSCWTKILGYRVSHKKDVRADGLRCSLCFEVL